MKNDIKTLEAKLEAKRAEAGRASLLKRKALLGWLKSATGMDEHDYAHVFHYDVGTDALREISPITKYRAYWDDEDESSEDFTNRLREIPVNEFVKALDSYKLGIKVYRELERIKGDLQQQVQNLEKEVEGLTHSQAELVKNGQAIPEVMFLFQATVGDLETTNPDETGTIYVLATSLVNAVDAANKAVGKASNPDCYGIISIKQLTNEAIIAQ